MTLDERTAGPVTIVTVGGDITLASGAEVLLKDKIRSLLQQGRQQIVLDMSGVSYVDSAGLGQLVQSHVTVSRSGGALKLLGATKRLNDLLVVTRLVTVFDCYDQEAAALASF